MRRMLPSVPGVFFLLVLMTLRQPATWRTPRDAYFPVSPASRALTDGPVLLHRLPLPPGTQCGLQCFVDTVSKFLIIPWFCIDGLFWKIQCNKGACLRAKKVSEQLCTQQAQSVGTVGSGIRAAKHLAWPPGTCRHGEGSQSGLCKLHKGGLGGGSWGPGGK